MNPSIIVGLHGVIEWMSRMEGRLTKLEERMVVIERRSEPQPAAEERNYTMRGFYTLKEFAEKVGLSVYTVQRAISHGLIKTVYFGKRPMIASEEYERVRKPGLGPIPPGYLAEAKRPKPDRPDRRRGKRLPKANPIPRHG